MDQILCTKPLPGFTVGKVYPAAFKAHRGIKPNLQTGISRCVETENDAGKLIYFTRLPSTSWHIDYMKFTESFKRKWSEFAEGLSQDDVCRLHFQFSQETGVILNEAQIAAARFILNREGCLLEGETGTGKTKIALFCMWYGNTVLGRYEIVCVPPGLVGQWHQEITSAKLNTRIEVVNYNNCPDDFGYVGKGFEVYLDEAHILCHLSESAWGFIDWAQWAVKRVALTATPDRVEGIDRFSIMGWALVKQWQWGGTSKKFPYGPEDRARYEQDKFDTAEYTFTLTLPEVRPSIPELKLWRYDKTLALVNGLLRERNRPTIVFCNEHETVYRLMRDAVRVGRSCAEITGRINPKHRKDSVDSFNAGTISLLYITSAMGVGLSLQGAQDIVFYDMPHGIVQLTQCMGRGYRFNTNKEVNVFFRATSQELEKCIGQMYNSIGDYKFRKTSEIPEYRLTT